MILWMSCREVGRNMPMGLNLRRINVKWETPTAVDFRFGMEITMYIANR